MVVFTTTVVLTSVLKFDLLKEQEDLEGHGDSTNRGKKMERIEMICKENNEFATKREIKNGESNKTGKTIVMNITEKMKKKKMKERKKTKQSESNDTKKVD